MRYVQKIMNSESEGMWEAAVMDYSLRTRPAWYCKWLGRKIKTSGQAAVPNWAPSKCALGTLLLLQMVSSKMSHPTKIIHTI